MREVGKVIKVEKNNIKVRIGRKSACASCNMCGMKSEAAHIDILTENTVNAKIGDSVELELETSVVMFSAGIIYIVPLVTALIGFFIAYILKVSEVMQFAFLMIGTFVGFIFVSIIDKLVKKKKFIPKCIKIIEESNQVEKIKE